MMRTIAIMALVLAGVAPVRPAAAAEVAHGDVVRAAIRHADLDLAKAGHVRELDRRIGRAARMLCGEASDADVAGKNVVRQCRSVIRARLSDTRRTLILAARRTGNTALMAR